LQDLDLQGRIILKRICKKWDGDMDWFDPAQDRGQAAGCCEFGNEPLVPHNARYLLTGEQLLACHEGLPSTELVNQLVI